MTKRAATDRDRAKHRPTKAAGVRNVAFGLMPVSQATQIANRFLAWYLLASIVWILGSDRLLDLASHFVPVPAWVNSAKGMGYVLVLGLALRRATRVYIEGVERSHAVHIDSNLELVRRLSLAAEYRDDETGGHNQRIGSFAAIVAAELGLDEKACETLSYAASLHDIGKIGMPDSLLLKEGPFNAQERETMRSHTILGAEILAGGDHPLVKMSHIIALTHHERWDGLGYPFGLKGAEIPLEGRIVAVCDVYDALTSERPYKDAWTVKEAAAEITRLRGSHFQPAVVDAFMRCLPAIEATRRQRLERPILDGRADSVLQTRLAG